jgi:hypothetical protein
MAAGQPPPAVQQVADSGTPVQPAAEVGPLQDVDVPGLTREEQWEVACGLIGQWGDPDSMKR